LPPSEEEAVVEVTVRDAHGLHARPVMQFVEKACGFASSVWVTNLSLRAEKIDGKSAMQMMLLEATRGCVLRIEARGPDAKEAVAALGVMIDVESKPETGA
jgi:phosphotransferase system HPr (HPr) family protein